MQKRLLLSAAALLVLFSGCGLLTLHPIFTPRDLITDNRIIGKWKSEEGYTQFEPASKAGINEIPEALKAHREKFYLCTRYGNDGQPDKRFLAFLVRIGNNHFIDLYPLQDKTDKIDPFFSSHDLKMHTVSKIKFKANSIVWLDFRDYYVDDLIRKKQVRITHTYITRPESADREKEIVITAPTRELQAFLQKYGNHEEAFNPEDKSNTYYKIN